MSSTAIMGGMLSGDITTCENCERPYNTLRGWRCPYCGHLPQGHTGDGDPLPEGDHDGRKETP